MNDMQAQANQEREEEIDRLRRKVDALERRIATEQRINLQLNRLMAQYEAKLYPC